MAAVADASWNSAAGMQDPGQERLFIKFGMHAVKNEEKSLEAGRPIFEDREFVNIMVPGDKQNVIHREVRPDDKERFSRQYAAWKGGNGDQLVGTPLAEWPAVTRSQVEELAYHGVRTVEQLAAVSDGNASKMGPIQALRQKARDFVEQAKGNVPLEKMRAELVERDNLIATMRKQLEDQGNAISKLQKGK